MVLLPLLLSWCHVCGCVSYMLLATQSSAWAPEVPQNWVGQKQVFSFIFTGLAVTSQTGYFGRVAEPWVETSCSHTLYWYQAFSMKCSGLLENPESSAPLAVPFLQGFRCSFLPPDFSHGHSKPFSKCESVSKLPTQKAPWIQEKVTSCLLKTVPVKDS